MMRSIACLILLSTAQMLVGHRIGLCIIATGKYNLFAEWLIPSARTYFLPAHDVHYFVFTDSNITPARDITVIYQPKLGWPYDTLMRFAIYARHAYLFESYDYIFALDADMLLTNLVGEEILSQRVGTQHPGFVNKRGSYETNIQSLACVTRDEGTIYFAGGFYGGTRNEFCTLCTTLAHRIETDHQRNIIACWHDESHLNRYFIDFPPTKILSPAYCYPEERELPYEKKILALNKNHQEMRSS